MKEPDPGKALLITGMPRSRTTWAGRVLSAPGDVGYLLEPFNRYLHGFGQFAPRMPWLFPYIAEHNEARYIKPVRDMLSFRYRPLAALYLLNQPRILKRSLGQARTMRQHRRLGHRPLVKDPGAIFSAEWLATRFSMEVIIMVRHPAAVAASFKQLGWRFPFGDLLKQDELMRERLADYRAEIEQFAADPEGMPLVENAALLWKVVNAVVVDYQRRHPDWRIIRHEDMTRDPEALFRALCDALGLDYEPAVAKTIRAQTLGIDEPPQGSPFAIRRQPAEAIASWCRKLTPDEIDTVRRRCEPIASEFYDAIDWAPPEGARG